MSFIKQALIFSLMILSLNSSYFPPNFDLRDEFDSRQCDFTSIEEGLCSANWAVILSQTLATYNCIKNQKLSSKLSAQQLIDCTNNDNTNSSTLDKCQFFSDEKILYNALDYIQNTGITTDKCYNYTSLLSGQDNKCLDKCRSGENFPEPIKANNIKFESDKIEEVKNHIVEHGPVIVLVREYDGMLHYTVQEITNKRENAKYDNDLGLRVLRIIGWITVNDIEYWIAGNSWGKNWGVVGYMYSGMDSEYIVSYHGLILS